MQHDPSRYGLVGQTAPELDVPRWVDGNGQETAPVKLSDSAGKFRIIYCFQSWCPGCHSHGLPSLQKLQNAFGDDERVELLAIQTVFEGKSSNTYEKLLETQKKYDLKIPFGQDEGGPDTRNVASVMYNYRTGGTPWFIFIDQDDRVVFNDFHIDADKAIEYLNGVLDEQATAVS